MLRVHAYTPVPPRPDSVPVKCVGHLALRKSTPQSIEAGVKALTSATASIWPASAGCVRAIWLTHHRGDRPRSLVSLSVAASRLAGRHESVEVFEELYQLAAASG